MSREQIEEMAKVIEQSGMLDSYSRCQVVSEELYNADYRKIIFCKGCVYCEHRYPVKAVGMVAEEGLYCNMLKQYVEPEDFCSLAKM